MYEVTIEFKRALNLVKNFEDITENFLRFIYKAKDFSTFQLGLLNMLYNFISS